jgi:hypothetical protein
MRREALLMWVMNYEIAELSALQDLLPQESHARQALDSLVRRYEGAKRHSDECREEQGLGEEDAAA